jgi:hypothetical protein
VHRDGGHATECRLPGHRFNLDGLAVYFPYDYVYKEQREYMLEIKLASVLFATAQFSHSVFFLCFIWFSPFLTCLNSRGKGRGFWQTVSTLRINRVASATSAAAVGLNTNRYDAGWESNKTGRQVGGG